MLEDYSTIFSTVASLSTVPLLLSPALVCRDFIKKGSSDHVKSFIFVSGLMRCLLFLQHGILLNLRPLLIVHSIGTILYTIYTFLYYVYLTDKASIAGPLGKAALLVAVLIGYTHWESPTLVTNRFGWIVTTLHLILLAIPLKYIIRAKSTEGMPFPIIFCVFIVSVSWLLYGISINNNEVIFQMIIGVLLSGFQLSLFIIYPSKKVLKPLSKIN